METLFESPGQQRWISVYETDANRFLLLDGCEEGAMHLLSEDPVFDYLWFHKCSHFNSGGVRRALVLGAGAFTIPKCLALDYPDAQIQTIDSEADLEIVGRRYFRLNAGAFTQIHFMGVAAQEFITWPLPQFDFLFDDVFDAPHQVPATCLGQDYFRRLRRLLSPRGVCVKNLVWDSQIDETKANCDQAMAAWREVFPNHVFLGLGLSFFGYNLLLIGQNCLGHLNWDIAQQSLAKEGVPQHILQLGRQLVEEG